MGEEARLAAAKDTASAPVIDVTKHGYFKVSLGGGFCRACVSAGMRLRTGADAGEGTLPVPEQCLLAWEEGAGAARCVERLGPCSLLKDWCTGCPPRCWSGASCLRTSRVAHAIGPPAADHAPCLSLGQVLGKGELPTQAVVVRAKFVSKLAERKIKEAGGAVQLVA